MIISDIRKVLKVLEKKKRILNVLNSEFYSGFIMGIEDKYRLCLWKD